MEKLNLKQMSFFLDQEIYLFPEDSTPSPTSVEEEEVTYELEYEGGFEQGVMIIHEGESLEEESKSFLFKIINATNCSLKDIALFHEGRLEGLPLDVLMSMNPKKVIVFGVLRHDIMAMMQKKYKVEMEGDVEMLFVDDPAQIAGNQELKKSLWNCLKTLFKIEK